MNIDIIIPCFNAEGYLGQAIGSALEQTLAPRQIIVVDDGSTDGSLALARKFERACDGQVRVHSERSGNAARTRNIGASLSDADALMFLDADDVLAPDALAALAGALAQQPNGIAACPWRRLKLVEGIWTSRPPSCAPRRPDQDALSAWMTGWYYPPCAMLWSRTAFVESGRWDEEIAMNQDGDLVMRALAYGFPLRETTSGTAYYRALPEGEVSLSSRKSSYKGLSSRLTVIEKICWILEEKGQVDRYRSSIALALALVERNAARHYDGLGQQARLRKQHYAPALWDRLAERLRRARRGNVKPRPEARRTVEGPDEIGYGLECAEQIVRRPESPPSGARELQPVADHRPTVSVIIPVFNRAHLLGRTLDSVVAQSFDDFEVLVVDDGSDDDPASVVESYRDPRLHYKRQPENKGVAAARNRGLREAKGEFIAFLDDDDEWFPEKLALQVDLFKHSSPDVGLIYTGVETVSDAGNVTRQVPSARGDLYPELLVRNVFHGGGSNIMVRRNVIARVGYFDESLPAIEDYDYWLRITRWYRAEVISTPLIRYNDFRSANEASASQERRSLNIQANLAARARFFEKYGARMRAAGLAHHFLITSGRRSLDPGWEDVRGARRLAFQAFLLAPTAWGARDLLIRTCGLSALRDLAHRTLHMLGRLQTPHLRLRGAERSRR